MIPFTSSNEQSGTNDSRRAHHSSSEPRSILVIDDERPIVSFMRDLLEDEGYDVRWAYDGEQAVEILRRNPCAVVISDVFMPRASGHDVMRYVQSIPQSRAPKMILMSAALEHSPHQQVPLLLKPFEVDELLDLVDAALEEFDGERSA